MYFLEKFSRRIETCSEPFIKYHNHDFNASSVAVYEDEFFVGREWSFFVGRHSRIRRARFSKGPESFRAPKAIIRSFVSKSEEEYTPETSCAKATSLHL